MDIPSSLIEEKIPNYYKYKKKLYIYIYIYIYIYMYYFRPIKC